LTDVILKEFGIANSAPWDAETQLYQPFEVEQCLLYEYAETLSVRTFLKMCNLPYKIEMRANAEYMSPSGQVPFLRCHQNLVIADFEPIVEFVAMKGVQLSDLLSENERADLVAQMALVKHCFLNAELFICWVHSPTLNAVTSQRYGSVYPWPLKWIVPKLRQRQMKNRLQSFGWGKKDLAQVLEEVDCGCQVFSIKLGDKDFFYGDKPTELDALVFGHLFTILTTELPDIQLAAIVKKYDNLLKLCTRIEKEYFFHHKSLVSP